MYGMHVWIDRSARGGVVLLLNADVYPRGRCWVPQSLQFESGTSSIGVGALGARGEGGGTCHVILTSEGMLGMGWERACRKEAERGGDKLQGMVTHARTHARNRGT